MIILPPLPRHFANYVMFHLQKENIYITAYIILTPFVLLIILFDLIIFILRYFYQKYHC